MDNLLRSGAACKALGIHHITLYRWIKKGVLPAIRLPSGEFRIKQSDIDTILTHGRLTAKRPKRRRL